MQLLMILSVTGALSGLLSGVYVSGFEGMVLGASAGLVAGVVSLGLCRHRPAHLARIPPEPVF